ncbi:hypothetical protein JOB18_047582 [Solea senegalensis]|uniref:RNMT-activating mini protein n=1 Tax=Solea senegalensis TaxID=28829 RepID=A0AAV6Q551_SOLSE|nr:RNA guanine-N7 methyltransferase activating subunit-like [Solea senegalensis]KAG7483401.1 RNMT-activating mini protein [Solea senegalensis]KAG7483402.1 hypothetical protein JOB18_047582 [Solea senegalensis]
MTESTENMQKYEELFAHRFSSEDQEYQQYVNRPTDSPPIVEDWARRGGWNQRGRDNRYQDRHGHRGRGWGGDQGWSRQQHWRDRDRSWGHGSQSGPPSANQGYNSHHHRPRYNPY